jgi:Na+/H+-dicarboxylate symporter
MKGTRHFGEPNTAPVDINIIAIAAGIIMTLVWTFSWAQAWNALGVVFVAAVLTFIIPIVIFARGVGREIEEKTD